MSEPTTYRLCSGCGEKIPIGGVYWRLELCQGSAVMQAGIYCASCWLKEEK